MSVLLILVSVSVALVAFAILVGGPRGGGDVQGLSGEAQLRSCPSTTCESTATLRRGSSVIHIGTEKGEPLFGTDEWTRVATADGSGYVHSYFLADSGARLAASLETAVTGILVLTAFGLLWLARPRRSTGAQSSVDGLPGLLFAGVTGAGVLGLVAAFSVSMVASASFTGFLADSLLNLGAGLIGAAITFVLFQVLLTRRAADGADAADLRREIRDLRHQLELAHRTAAHPGLRRRRRSGR